MSGKKLGALILVGIMAMVNCKSTSADQDADPEVSTKGSLKEEVVSSSFLSRNMSYYAYLPPDYSSQNNDFPILYLLHGYWGSYSDWPQNGMKTVLDNMIENGSAEPMIVIMPDGIDSFYCNDYDDRNLKYESFFVEEFIPEIEQKYRVKDGKTNHAIAGLSMGGYGATYHGMKYHNRYGFVYSMSGALDLNGNEPSVREIINNKTEQELADLPVYGMDIGTEDFLYSNNVSFSQFLTSKSIPHEFQDRPGSHDWDFWMSSLPGVIAGYSDFLKSEN